MVRSPFKLLRVTLFSVLVSVPSGVGVIMGVLVVVAAVSAVAVAVTAVWVVSGVFTVVDAVVVSAE